MFDNFWYALALTSFAGLSTGIGGLISIFGRPDSKRFLSCSLGFSAGVMIYVSFVELFAQSLQIITVTEGKLLGMVYTNLAFFTGMGLIVIIDRLVPSFENPHEIPKTISKDADSPDSAKLIRLGLLSALAISLHNFPEGMATFAASMKDPELGLSIALAIGIHNIPEGIAVAVPIYQATRNKTKAIVYSFLAGACEPIGALFAFALMSFYWSEFLVGLILAAVAGVMVFISFDQLLPNAERYGEHHYSVYGLVAGMMVMASSLILF